MTSESAIHGALTALRCILQLTRRDRVMIVCDEELLSLGSVFQRASIQITPTTVMMLLAQRHKRTEQLAIIEEMMEAYRPVVAVNILRVSAEDTPFRIRLLTLEHDVGCRVGHMPGPRYEWLVEGPLALSDEDYEDIMKRADSILQRVSGKREVRITTPDGTDFRFELDTSRPWKTDCIPGMDWFVNLPVGEVFTAPIEESGEGVLVVRGAIGDLGTPPSPLRLYVREGRVERVLCEDRGFAKRVWDVLNYDEGARLLGEFGIGLNPHASPFSDSMLEAEKAANTIHIAFGYNASFKGKNNSEMHRDFLVLNPRVELEGEPLPTALYRR